MSRTDSHTPPEIYLVNTLIHCNSGKKQKTGTEVHNLSQLQNPKFIKIIYTTKKDKKNANWLLCLYNKDFELTSTPTEID